MKSEALDEFDRKILRALQVQGDLTAEALGQKVALTSSPAWRRATRLKAEGYITGTVALVDPLKVGLDVLAYVSVTLKTHAAQPVEDLLRQIELRPRCWSAPL